MPQLEVKSADVLDLDVRFVSGGQVVDLTSAAVVSFGLVQASQPGSGLLVSCQAFNRMDSGETPPLDIWYRGQPNFYTTNLQAALGTSSSLACLGEVRFASPDSSVTHSLNFPVQVDAVLIPETYPPITVLSTYPSIGTIQLKTEKNQPNGYAGLSPSGYLSTSVIPPGVEWQSNKGVPGGYVPLASSGTISTSFLDPRVPLLSGSYLSPAVVPIDGVTISVVGGVLQASGAVLGVLTSTTEPFTTPAIGVTVPISAPTGALTAGALYVIGTAGSFVLTTVTDALHGVYTYQGGGTGIGATVPFGQNVTLGAGPPGAQGIQGIQGTQGIQGIQGPGGSGALTWSSLVGTPVALDTLSATSDNSFLNSSTSAHGLLRKLDGNATHYLNGLGAWSTPAGSGSGSGSITLVDANPGLPSDAISIINNPSGK
jgi:hypothetical protein